MKKLCKLFVVILATLSVVACGKEDKVTLSESSISKVTCTKQSDNKTYRCVVFSDGVNDDNTAVSKDEISVLGVRVLIDSEKEVITEVQININKESEEYGKALLEGAIVRIPDAVTFYNKYVKIGTDGLSFKEVDKLKYTTTKDIKSVCNRENATESNHCGSGGKEIDQPADLATGATGTAAAYANVLKAAIEEYKNIVEK